MADDPEFTEGHAGLLRVRSLDAGWPGRKEVATGSQKDASPRVAEASRAVALRGHVEGRGLEMFAGALVLGLEGVVAPKAPPSKDPAKPGTGSK